MEQWHLTPELKQLERELVARRPTGPSGELRDRVQRTVRAGLHGRRPTSWRMFAAAAAAAAVFWINLSWCLVRSTEFGLWPREHTRRPVSDLAGRLRGEVAELSETEAKQQAVLLHARAALSRDAVPPVLRVPSPDFSTENVPF